MILQVTCNKSGNQTRRKIHPNPKMDLKKLVRKWCRSRDLVMVGLDAKALGDYSAKLAEDPDSVTCWESVEFWAVPIT